MVEFSPSDELALEKMSQDLVDPLSDIGRRNVDRAVERRVVQLAVGLSDVRRGRHHSPTTAFIS